MEEHIITKIKKEIDPQKSKKKAMIKWGLIVVGILLLIVIVYLGSQIAARKRQEIEPVQTEQPATPAPTTIMEPTPAPWPNPKVYKPNERDINFEELWKTNPDVIGWVEIPGTKVDYPILAYKEDDYYLTHDFNGKSSKHGAIYIDNMNEDDFDKPQVVLYGHNMRDGSMFATLHRFEKQEFFEQNRLIKVYTPKGQLDYEIMSAYERDDYYILQTYNAADKTEYEGYLNWVRSNTDKNAHIKMDGVTVDDSIITLTTCIGGKDAYRYVVEARYIRP